MELLGFIFYLVYVAMALTPLVIIFILGKDFGTITILQFTIPNSILYALSIMVFALLFSYFYIHCVKKYNSDTQSEQIECSEIEIAEPKYIPIYITYFVIAVSINDFILFCFVFILIYLLILRGKFSYFNPYLLFSYHFYEASINTKQDRYAQYKIFLISKQKIKNIRVHDNLIRLNDFTFLEKGAKSD